MLRDCHQQTNTVRDIDGSSLVGTEVIPQETFAFTGINEDCCNI
jgi:hypothetical protein